MPSETPRPLCVLDRCAHFLFNFKAKSQMKTILNITRRAITLITDLHVAALRGAVSKADRAADRAAKQEADAARVMRLADDLHDDAMDATDAAVQASQDIAFAARMEARAFGRVL